MKLSSAIPVLSLLLVSCAATQNREVMNRAGKMPPPEFAEARIRAHLSRNLKDPDSLKQFAITRTFLKSYNRGLINGGGFDEGWLVCYEYNAKNSYGGYTGLSAQGIMFRQSGDSWIEVPGLWGPATGDC